MKKRNLKKILLALIVITFTIHNSYAQDETEDEIRTERLIKKRNKWVFGVGFNAVDFFPFNTEGNGNSGGFLNELTNAEDHWNIGGPKLHATRLLWNRLAVEGAFSLNTIKLFGETQTEKESYLGVDFNAQYSLFSLEKKFNIALSLGGGYTFAYKSGGTFNIGGNINWWFSKKFGLNLQGMMKYNSPDYSLAPHMYYAFSMVFRPDGKGLFLGGRFRWRNGL